MKARKDGQQRATVLVGYRQQRRFHGLQPALDQLLLAEGTRLLRGTSIVVVAPNFSEPTLVALINPLKGKFNVPVPILPGFVETWLSKMAKHVTLSFEQQEDADYIAARKVTALYTAEKNHDDYDWDMMDTDGKKMASLVLEDFTGQATAVAFTNQYEKFKDLMT